MKASPLLVAWHDENTPIYSAHFQRQSKGGRLATAGGDNHVRLWKIESSNEDRKVTYLSTLKKHTGAVNVVRWCPKGDILASAGDDGNVLLWVPDENKTHTTSFDNEGVEDKEHWRIKNMIRPPMQSEIYDLAWSPDGVFFIMGSMDNIARIYDAETGNLVRQIAEHNHFVQGVAWDPLNEYLATQSSDRSVHIYKLKNRDGQFSLAQHGKVTRMDLPSRRVSSSSPAPPDFGARATLSASDSAVRAASPVPSAPGTPHSLALPMNPPPTTHSRRSSFGSRRSASPAPSMPLPAVMPSASPNVKALANAGVKNAPIYANESCISFFRRLTFAPDGSLLFTPAGQYKTVHPSATDPQKSTEEITNTVYIYSRAGLNKPPVAHLPGHKKPSVAVSCSPVYYTLRQSIPQTKYITIDSSLGGEIPALPDSVMSSRPPPPTSHAPMDPPPPTSAPSPSPSLTAASPKAPDSESQTSNTPSSAPAPAFRLPYRMVYAVATQDAVHIYDTQQTKPLCIVSNLHLATFTDITWSSDGLTLIISSSDGFCSALAFSPGELGEKYTGPTAPPQSHHVPPMINTAAPHSSNQSTPTPTPTSSHIPLPPPSTTGAPSPTKQPSSGFPASPSSFIPARPGSPARSNSVSSIATASSFAPGGGDQFSMNAPTPTLGQVPGLAAANSGPVGVVPVFTPPYTPAHGHGGTHSASSSVSGVGPAIRRESESEREEGASASKKRDLHPVPEADEEGRQGKRRRIAPTLVSNPDVAMPSTEEGTSGGQGEPAP
ncbi:WD40 repeat-like protein [Sporormia fimetaria CBS 119925]|uniref:WD40 repeat-like protein n=1 Tax=Sporormia fimetaria CBS 119925 TaxID=1340428 RepID=A0A6A6VRD5_9PLEO|nr:WD40 repeat-like protein [Sporormia fimetaria CBS 119925]